jgi:hypothetical protein
MTTEPYFSSKFRREKDSDGKYMYWFTPAVNLETSASSVDSFPFVLDGLEFNGSDTLTYAQLTSVPEDLHNPSIFKLVYTQWLKDCSGAFVKPPTLEQCLAKTIIKIDTSLSLPPVLSEEEDDDWVLRWIPTKLKVHTPVFEIFWAPCYKVRARSRIELEDTISQQTEPIEVQNPEKTYTFVPQPRPVASEWIQELADLHVPYADDVPLRLDTDANSDAQKEKLRRKVREARIRAKLARYRAERMASRFEERYGFYPEEDEEEAQTEVETDNDE